MLGLEWYHCVLITMAVVAGIAAWEVPRAVLWLCIGSFFYVVTAYWHNIGGPFAILFGAFTNFLICVLLAWPRENPAPYEMKVFNAYILMLVVDAIYVFGFIQSHFVFAVSLEIVSAAAMFLITVTGIADRIKRHEGHHHSGRSGPVIDYCDRALLKERAAPQKWWEN